MHIIVRKNQKVTVAACGLLLGERFLVKYKILTSCGKTACTIDYKPNGKQVYIGEADGSLTDTTANIMDFPFEGWYEFVPDGVVAATAMVYEVSTVGTE